jgi:hypothetical protein
MGSFPTSPRSTTATGGSPWSGPSSPSPLANARVAPQPIVEASSSAVGSFARSNDATGQPRSSSAVSTVESNRQLAANR